MYGGTINMDASFIWHSSHSSNQNQLGNHYSIECYGISYIEGSYVGLKTNARKLIICNLQKNTLHNNNTKSLLNQMIKH